MPSATFQCAASADDAVEDGGGVVSLLETEPNNDDTDWSYTAVRFPNVTIAQGSTMSSGTVLRVVISNSGLDEPLHDIYGFATDNCSQFVSGGGGNISGRARTTATVLWSSTNLGAPGTFDIDVTSIINEIVNRPGWVANNALGLVIITRGTISRDLAFTHYDGSSSNAPKLVSTWVEPGGGGGSSATNKFLPLLGAG